MIEPTSNDERQYSAMSDDCKWSCYCTDDYFALSHYSGSANIHHQLTVKQAQEIIELLQAGIKWTTNAQATTK